MIKYATLYIDVALEGKTWIMECKAINLRVEANTLNQAKILFANALKRVKKDVLENAVLPWKQGEGT